MTERATISLRAGERIFMNGAVLRADRPVTLELLNEVPYLFEHEILQIEQTTTPLKQLYYVLQMMIMDPGSIPAAREVFECSSRWLIEAVENQTLLAGIELARDRVARERYFDALKAVRDLFDVEETVLGHAKRNGVRYLEAV